MLIILSGRQLRHSRSRLSFLSSPSLYKSLGVSPHFSCPRDEAALHPRDVTNLNLHTQASLKQHLPPIRLPHMLPSHNLPLRSPTSFPLSHQLSTIVLLFIKTVHKLSGLCVCVSISSSVRPLCAGMKLKC